MVTFLPDPKGIRKAIYRLQCCSDRLDLAAAFIGADWQEILNSFKGKIRIICWLSSTNTNAYAVENLTKRKNTLVRQREGMHCKVYIAPTAAVIGSANLSGRALSESDNAGQDEAAVLVEADPSCLRRLTDWFNRLWKELGTRPIENNDLKAAKKAFDKARNRGAESSEQSEGDIRSSPHSSRSAKVVMEMGRENSGR